MRYIISCQDAYWFWYHAGASARARFRAADISNLEDVAHTAHQLEGFDLSKLEGLLDPPPRLASALSSRASARPGTKGRTQPAIRAQPTRRHVLVPGTTDGRPLQGYDRYRWHGPVPSGTLAVILPGVAVCSPEFCLLQLALRLQPIEFARWATALCASYRIGERGIEECEPVTSVRRIEDFLTWNPGHRGVAACRKLLPYLRDGARSPKEVELHLLLALPSSLGGYGLGGDVLNWRLDLGSGAGDLLDRPDRRLAEVDLAWPAKKVGLEYMGRDHDGKVPADRRRLNMLTALGMRILQVDAAQVSDPALLDRTARQLARLLKRKVPEPTDAWLSARGDLRQILLGAGHLRM